ncbi:GCN5-related N-acetyltransferase [Desulfarculus baarsii DSM 2075]|uniref:GCN5-related N-acetyltransferase n=1 Tax=Desulfarculus baarsii (strain ATCC 33931 / DSM 2075 / LMG 7858 / VKM B-1802 / 2st14) TaxID=644282 RepID=E1QMH4_DESB2|nr:N-acetyltransferase [Desulfarculus baarsii]ADK86217.1 GCN5-related N-acetyltransferase [Desulfarculus baarsii DSM 2075]
MIRRARQSDVAFIHAILARFGREGRLLGRPLTEIYDFLRDFLIAEDASGAPIGVCGLHLCWENLAEVRSLAVLPEAQGKGVGTKLVEACCSEALTMGFNNVFTLTYRPEFFQSLGFRVVDKQLLPNKIWADCIKCVKFPNCDETALLLEM